MLCMLKDSTTVAIPTFLAGVLGGPIGAVLGIASHFVHLIIFNFNIEMVLSGACIGTTFLGVSKAKGVNHYKPLLTALEEDFTEQERQQLYERVWGRLQGFVTSPLTQSLIYVALNELSTAAQFNPNVLDNIRNEINKTLRMRSMTLG